MSDKKKDAKEADKVEDKDKKNEGLGLLEEVSIEYVHDSTRSLFICLRSPLFISRNESQVQLPISLFLE